MTLMVQPQVELKCVKSVKGKQKAGDKDKHGKDNYNTNGRRDNRDNQYDTKVRTHNKAL